MNVWRGGGEEETAAEDKEEEMVPRGGGCIERANNHFNEGERLRELTVSPDIKSQTSFPKRMAAKNKLLLQPGFI